MYHDGYSAAYIGKLYNISYQPIYKVLRQQNIIIRSKQESSRKFAINQNYFDDIGSEDKAYYLGLLFADGCNNIKRDGSHTISIGLLACDSYILEKLSFKIYGTDKVTNDGKTANLRVHSKHMSEKLASYGCVPRKSLILQFPTIVPDSLMHHFMRGYFDGDGCIYLYKKRNGKIDAKVTVVSTMDFCDKYRSILEYKTQISSIIRQDKRDAARGNTVTRVLEVGGNLKILKLYEFLYADSNYFLNRKKDKFTRIFDSLNKK